MVEMVSGKGWTLWLAHSLSWEAELRNGFQTRKVSPRLPARGKSREEEREGRKYGENKKVGGRRRGRKG